MSAVPVAAAPMAVATAPTPHPINPPTIHIVYLYYVALQVLAEKICFQLLSRKVLVPVLYAMFTYCKLPAMYQQASPFRDKRQTAGIIPNP